MRVVAGADDQGPSFDAVTDEILRRGLELEVVERSSWPAVAIRVAEAVASGAFDMGLLMCWTGTGTCIMANKVPGVRAALCWEPWIAEGARRWNDANVLVMSLKRTDPDAAAEILSAWLGVERPDEDELANIERVAQYERALAAGRGSKSNPIPF